MYGNFGLYMNLGGDKVEIFSLIFLCSFLVQKSLLQLNLLVTGLKGPKISPISKRFP
jgi:hypothetical protein